jgi:hypothetical protein
MLTDQCYEFYSFTKNKMIQLGGNPGQLPGNLMLQPLAQCWTNHAYKQDTKLKQMTAKQKKCFVFISTNLTLC